MKHFIFLFAFTAFLSSCGTFDGRSIPTSTDGEVRADRIDYDGIRTELGLDRAIDDLGYEERRFNTCNIGNGYSSSSRCQDLTMMVLHFKLLCRNSTGTVSAIAQTAPMDRANIRWELAGSSGITQTNRHGYAQISLVSRYSKGSERLIIHIGDKYFGGRAHELKMHVLPGDWCDKI